MRVDHIAIACHDVESLKAWYERVLGFVAVVRKESSRTGGQTAYLVGPGGSAATLELMGDDGAPPPQRQPFTRGISHIALAVESIAESEKHLTALGVEWLGERGEALGGGFVRSFLDPEGNMLQIVERPDGWRAQSDR